jgi:hypothetical protein
MFGDYTIEQAAIVLDTCDEVVIEVIKGRGIPTHRKYLLFGEIMLNKPFVDSIAPEVRALMRRNDGTRTDWERKKREREKSEQQLRQSEDELQEIYAKRQQDQEAFLKQWNELMEQQAKKVIANLESDQK